MIGYRVTKVREAKRDISLNEFETFLSAQQVRIGKHLGTVMGRIAYARGARGECDRDDAWFNPETCEVEVRK